MHIQRIILFIAGVVLLLTSYAIARDFKASGDIKTTPAIITADDMKYDAKEEIVSASGKVEVIQGNRILMADTVTYNKNSNIVKAKGNISLLEPSGDVLFADEVELHDDLKKGVIQNFSARFIDNSTMAAKKAKRIKEDQLVLSKVVYSPCKLCKDKPNTPPVWQVKANKATINNQEQRVIYNSAFFEIYGVPVLYTPYFSHPTPNADRKSGFLTPKYATDKVFGTTIKTPYYYNISENKDATITPIFTSKEGMVLAGEYRHLLTSGQYTLKGSITNPDRVNSSGNKIQGKDVRGHVEGKGYFTINQYWDWGFDAKRASDDTYLQKYHFGNEDVLASNLYTSRIENRDHILLNTISFQGLKVTDDPGKTPLILPYGEMHSERIISDSQATASFDGNILGLTRSEGISTKRLSIKAGVKQPYVTKSGHLFSAGLSIRGDGYIVDNVPISPGNTQQTDNGFVGRTVPEATFEWSLPMAKYTQYRQYTVEPITRFIVSPNGSNPSKIPNEDSQDIELSDENLFDDNHFTGYDRIETGTRLNYGLRGSANDSRKGRISVLFGQSYRTKKDSNFGINSGLHDNFSDIVGKIGYNKNDTFDIAYKFRFDKDTLSSRKNAVSTGLKYKTVKFNLDYLAVDRNLLTDTSIVDKRELLIASSTINITDKWKLEGNGNRNLSEGNWVSAKASVLYRWDCVDLSFDWYREFTRDRDIQPNTTLSFQVNLKNFGQNK